ncbi:type VI immunity family protein [Paraburkholderia bannensis]|uniref:type VI immunity family protein n=1 Tax=Paraburkholderia bannensis TaxID=765414 RepID=UPI002ABD36A0|nr:type VI immunity family protein [Paraburkholderia bannensis]
MNPEEVIADLVQSHGGPCVFDRLHVPYDRPSAGPAAKFGLGCELYLPNSDRAALREQARQFLLDYHQMFPTRVVDFLPRDARRTVKIGGDLNTRIIADYEKNPEIDGGYSTALFGPVDIGLPKDDVPPYQAQVLLSSSSDHDLSFVDAYMPVCGDNAEPQFNALLEAVLRWSAICRPVHGSAGFTLIYGSGMSQNTTYTLPLMKRFPGFDFIHGVDFSLQAGAVHNRIKCVNWLTVLGDEIISELGGIAPIRDALEPVCRIHEYPGGVVIQADEGPQLGDTYRNDVPEAYRAVARYTKPVRFEAYRSRLFRVPQNLDKKEETLAWIRRFD